LQETPKARPHISILTRKTTAEFGWAVLPHLLYSPDLAPSDLHLFHPVKDGLHGKYFTNDDTVTVAMKKWLLEADTNSYERGCRLQFSDRENAYKVNIWKNKYI
jgi:histone-lysine N-methyltransferase SETMAR